MTTQSHLELNLMERRTNDERRKDKIEDLLEDCERSTFQLRVPSMD